MTPVDGNSTGLSRSGSGEWPLRLVVFGDFQPRHQSGWKISAAPQPRAVDKESFNGVLSEVVGDLALETTDSGAASSEELWIHLPLRTMRSFRPEAVAEAVPRLRELLLVRQRVAQFADGRLPFEELRSQVGGIREGARILERLRPAETVAVRGPKAAPGVRTATAPGRRSTAAQADDFVDSILGIVDLPGAGGPERGVPATTPETAVLISDLGQAAGGPAAVPSGAARKTIHELDGALSAGVERVLHHHEFRRLEALWRGLKLLVDRTDFREPIRIELRSVPKDSLADSLRLYAEQIEEAGGFDSDTVVLAAFEFDRVSRDIEILRSVSRTAESLQVPVVSSVGLAFFGLESAAEFERLSQPGALLDRIEYAKWRSLREAGSSRWLTLIFNRFLLRCPYGPDQDQVRGFEYRESLHAPPAAAHLWGNPVWGLAAVLARRFAAGGHCLDFTGWGNGAIEDLPIRELPLRGGQPVRSPLEVMLSEGQLADLARAGLLPLISTVNTDSAAVLAAPTVHQPERYADEEETRQARLRTMLPYQLLVSRTAVCAKRLAAAISPGLTRETVSALIKEVLLEFVPGRRNAAAVEAEVRDSVRSPDRYEVTLTVRPELAGWHLPAVQMQLVVHR